VRDWRDNTIYTGSYRPDHRFGLIWLVMVDWWLMVGWLTILYKIISFFISHLSSLTYFILFFIIFQYNLIDRVIGWFWDIIEDDFNNEKR